MFRELYSLYVSASNRYVRICVAWDIIELYLARGAKTHDPEAELEYLSRSSALSSLFKVLCMDPHYKSKLQDIEAVAPIVVGGQTVEFRAPKTISELVSLVRLARTAIFSTEVQPEVLRDLVEVLDRVVGPLVKELVPCV